MGHPTHKIQTHLLANLYRVSAPSWQQYTVTGLDNRRDDLALLVRSTGADSDDGRLGKRGTGDRRWQEDTRGGFLWVIRGMSERSDTLKRE